MNFENIPEIGFSTLEDEEGSIVDLLAKTKTQATKFFNDLNKHQRKSTQKMMSTGHHSEHTNFKKRLSNQLTLKQILKAEKENHSNQRFKTSQGSIRASKKKRTQRPIKSQEQKKDENGKATLEAVTSFNFFQVIKKMGLTLIQEKKQRQHSSNESESATVKPDESHHVPASGFTEKEFHDGTKFKGLCENGVIVKGQLHFSNGFVYNGELFLDKFHGKGSLQLPKKQIIEADWIDGQVNGKATIRYPKGQIYYGDLKNFRRHGKGHLFFNDGSKYEGEFNQGELTGYGVHITTKGERTAGYWFYGDFVGTNEQVFENIMANAAAHANKKSQKIMKSIFFTTMKNAKKTQISLEMFLSEKQTESR